MKKITIYTFLMTLILINVLGTQTLFAKDSSTSAFKSREKQKLSTIIVEAVKYPDFVLNKVELGDISVTFSLTDEGKIKVEKVIAPSKRLEDYVKEQLSNVFAKDVLHSYNQQFSVKFRFENS
jgi:hypothetical protein